MSAYGGEERIVHGVDSIQDLASRTPGFEYSASADRAYIRGGGREGDDVATDPGVATYVDISTGVPRVFNWCAASNAILPLNE